MAVSSKDTTTGLDILVNGNLVGCVDPGGFFLSPATINQPTRVSVADLREIAQTTEVFLQEQQLPGRRR